MMVVKNVLSYDAIVKRAQLLRHDMEKPLGAGLPSSVPLLGGEVHIGEFHSNISIFNNSYLKGQIASITGGDLGRDENGRIFIDARYRSPVQQLTSYIEAAGLDRYRLETNDEYISNDPENPSIFQGFAEGRQEPGLTVELFPGMKSTLPIGFGYKMYISAICSF
jgi:hypothetical protein